jgi:uncharacterized membrane protein YfcA
MEGNMSPVFANELSLVVLGACAGGCAGLLAGLLGIGGGVVIVPVVFYGLVLIVTGTVMLRSAMLSA